MKQLEAGPVAFENDTVLGIPEPPNNARTHRPDGTAKKERGGRGLRELRAMLTPETHAYLVRLQVWLAARQALVQVGRGYTPTLASAVEFLVSSVGPTIQVNASRSGNLLPELLALPPGE